MGCDGYIKGSGQLIIENGVADVTCYICSQNVDDLDEHKGCTTKYGLPVYMNTEDEVYIHGYRRR